MSNCIKKSVPIPADGIIKKYTSYFFQYKTARIMAFDPAMKNMGVTSFIIDMDMLDDVLDGHVKNTNGSNNQLDTLIEHALSIEYCSRVDLGVELTESYLDVMNIILSTNHFLDFLMKHVIKQPVGTTFILIEKQPDINNATEKIYETILSYFCNPKYHNVITKKTNVSSHSLSDKEKACEQVEHPVTALGYTAILPLEGYSKNSIALYSGIVDRMATKNTKYLQNKIDTASLFKQYCSNKGIKLDKKEKVDDIADTFCMTVFVVGKMVSYRDYCANADNLR